ncbi:hypothetical protein KI387_006091, partial [Taxus chinensis]
GPQDSWDVRTQKAESAESKENHLSLLFRAVWDSWDKSTRGMRIGRFADRQSIS